MKFFCSTFNITRGSAVLGKFDGILLISDMDGTLLDSNDRISDENCKAIDYFIAEGGKFTVASGRMGAAVQVFFDKLHINAPAVLYNGAMVYSFEEGKALYEKPLEEERKEACKRIYSDFPSFGMEIYSNERLYFWRKPLNTEMLKSARYNITEGLPSDVFEDSWTKVVIIAAENELNDYNRLHKSNYDTGMTVRTEPVSIDMIASGVSKGKCLETLIKHTGIGLENIYAVGDNLNDLDMIETAGHGFAVANAVDEVKMTAETILPSNNDSAVAYLINNIINR